MYVIVNGNNEVMVDNGVCRYFAVDVVDYIKANAYAELLEFETEKLANNYIKRSGFNRFVRAVKATEIESIRPLLPKRETAWVVANRWRAVAVDSFDDDKLWVWPSKLDTKFYKDNILRFTNRSDAETLARLLGIGEPKLVYTDDMTFVEGTKTSYT